MIDRDVVIQKINSIEKCLARIRSKCNEDAYALDDLDYQEIIVLNLQRAIQTTIDLAYHVISSEGLGLPSSLKDAFVILKDNKKLPTPLAQRLQKMVGFRNVAVHEYQRLDTKILEAVVKHHLIDFEKFCKEIGKHVLKN